MDVPGIGSITGERFSSHASASCDGLAWCSAAIARSGPSTGLPLTYPDVGATNAVPNNDVDATAGYRHVHVASRIGSGRAHFDKQPMQSCGTGCCAGRGVRVTASTEVAAAVGTPVLAVLQRVVTKRCLNAL